VQQRGVTSVQPYSYTAVSKCKCKTICSPTQCLCEEMGFLPSSKLSTSDVQKCKMRRQSAQCGNVVATRTDISETNVSTAGGGDIRGAMSISC